MLGRSSGRDRDQDLPGRGRDEPFGARQLAEVGPVLLGGVDPHWRGQLGSIVWGVTHPSISVQRAWRVRHDGVPRW